jgi:hypothetical protein
MSLQISSKCSNHHIIILMAPASKMVARILGRRIEKKIEDVLG